MIALENLYQIGYATNDFDRGLTALQEQFGVDGFAAVGCDEPVERRVRTPDGEVSVTLRAAIARMGDRSVEIFQPIAGETSIFTWALESGSLVRLHHFGMRCADLDAVRDEHQRFGRQIVMSGHVGEAQFMFVDARESLGHYLEYAHVPSVSGRAVTRSTSLPLDR